VPTATRSRTGVPEHYVTAIDRKGLLVTIGCYCGELLIWESRGEAFDAEYWRKHIK